METTKDIHLVNFLVEGEPSGQRRIKCRNLRPETTQTKKKHNLRPETREKEKATRFLSKNATQLSSDFTPRIKEIPKYEVIYKTRGIFG